MKKWVKKNWRVYILEFLSVFTAVVAAFGLSNWKSHQNDRKAEEKILVEIRNGLKADLDDLFDNRDGTELGIKSCKVFRNMVYQDSVAQDSILYNYLYLTISGLPLINNSGYEVLKSKGMEILENDSLRTHIINMYEFEYDHAYAVDILSKESDLTIKENIDLLLNKSFYYKEGNRNPIIKSPLKLSEFEKNQFLTYLFRIEVARFSSLYLYDELEEKLNALIDEINQELEDKLDT